MNREGPGSGPTRDPPGPDLAALVEAEARLDGQLAVARDQAEQLVAGARADAERVHARLAAAVAEEQRRIVAEIDVRTAERLAEIVARAEAELAGYQGLHGGDLEATARRLADRLAQLLLEGDST